MGYESLPTVAEARAKAESVRNGYAAAKDARPLATADRRLVRDLTRRRPKRLASSCVYCGAPCWGRACRGHRDLLDIEAEPTARHREVSAAGSDERTVLHGTAA